MVKTLIELSQRPPTEHGFADDEISPEAMAEIIRRVKKYGRGEGKVFTNEEVMAELGVDVDKVLELLESLGIPDGSS